jgi:hypothetical protein
MKFIAIRHIPTQQFFPHIESGSTLYDFDGLDLRPRARRFPRPPRLFGTRGLALRYITEYCKGVRSPDSFANRVTYIDPLISRSIYDFELVELTLTPGEIK